MSFLLFLSFMFAVLYFFIGLGAAIVSVIMLISLIAIVIKEHYFYSKNDELGPLV